VAFALATLATFSLAATPAPAREGVGEAGSYVWRDAAGDPLPFQTHGEILDFLRTADVVDREPIGRGVTGAERLVLERDGIRLRAAFRTVDETRRGPFEGLPPTYRRIRDAAVFECAAYELSQILGLGRVPPTVCRKIGDKDGSVQIWLEGVKTQDDYLEQPLDRSDVVRWNRQKRVLFVFDALVANVDRNQGNILVGPEGTVWFIDHTRTFALSRDLPEPEKVTRCSRDLWVALREMDEEKVRPRLEPFLRKGEIRSLFRRRATLVKHIEALIAAEGEDAVLFESVPGVSPAGDAAAPAATPR
jgi:hypothetical protein